MEGSYLPSCSETASAELALQHTPQTSDVCSTQPQAKHSTAPQTFQIHPLLTTWYFSCKLNHVPRVPNQTSNPFCFHSETGEWLCGVGLYLSERVDYPTSRPVTLLTMPHPLGITRGVKGTCTAERGLEASNYGYLLTGNPLSGCNRGTLLDGGTSWWPDPPLTDACEGRQLTRVRSRGLD